MKNKYRFFKIFVTILIFGFLLNFSLKRFSEKKITEDMVNVQLNEASTSVYFIDEKDIKKIVEKANPSGRVGGVDIPKLEKKIREIPAVDSANVYLNLNGRLNLDIKQRVPAFRLKRGDKDFYVDEKGVEFPTYKNYSHKCRLVSGDVNPEEYPQLIELVKKIEKDDFSKKYFVGIQKINKDYQLLTSDGFFKVELGSLENLDFKMNGFKAFVEKFLIYQDLEKYTKVSLKYNNQIVTTLNPSYQGNKETLQESTPTEEPSPQPMENVIKKIESPKNKEPKKQEPTKTNNKNKK